MKIGIGFNWVGIPLRKVLEVAIRAESLGFDSVWVAEDSMVTGRDSISLLACLAQVTQRMKLGTNILSVHHTRHIHLTAASIAALDEISEGRMIIGVGAGAGWPSYPANAKPIRMMRETIQGLRALLVGEELEFEGKRIILQHYHPAFPWELPSRVGRRIPIYLAAIGPKMTQLAGEIADGLVLELNLPPSEIPLRMKNLEHGVHKAGRNAGELDIACNIHIYATEDGNLADDMRLFTAYWLSNKVTQDIASRMDIDPAEVTAIRTAFADGDYQTAKSLITNPMAEAFGAAGSPDACLKKLKEYQSAGVQRAVLMPFGGDVELVLKIGAEFMMAA